MLKQIGNTFIKPGQQSLLLSKRKHGRMYAWFVWLAVAAFFFRLVALDLKHEQRTREQAQQERDAISDPIKLANYDRAHGDLELALQDLILVNRLSPEYQQAQALENEIRQQILSRNPAKLPATDIAEQNCRAIIKQSEEFPSTVDYKLFGTESTVDSKSL